MIKRFRSRTGEDVRVALTNGHVAIITSEWSPVVEILWEAAYAAGCVSEDMDVHKELDRVKDTGMFSEIERIATLKGKVKDAIMKAIKEDNIKAFTANSGPTAKYLREAVGEKVPTHIKNEVWEEVLDEGMTPYKENKDSLKNDIT